MTDLLQGFLSGSAAWGVLLTLAAFALGALLNKATGKAIFNPLLLGSIFVIILLSVLNISYADYKVSAAPVNYLLLPATISRDADAAGLDGEHLVDGLARKQALPLPCHLAEQRDVHLVVDKAVHLEHVAFAHNAVLADTIFQHLHKVYPPTLAGAFSVSGSPAAKSARLFSIPGRAPHAPII